MTNPIEKNVMASVRVIYAARSLVGGTAIRLYVLALSLAGIASVVSLSHVAANFLAVAHGGITSIATFLAVALLQTTLVVQVALMLGIISGWFLLRDIVHAAPRPFAHALS